MGLSLVFKSESERLGKEYIDGFCQEFNQSLLIILEAFDDQCIYTQEWRENHFNFKFYTQFSLDYSDYCDSLKSDIRDKKQTELSCEIIKHILRLNHIIDQYDKYYERTRKTNEEVTFTVITNSSHWKKISNQSHKILDLLRRK